MSTRRSDTTPVARAKMSACSTGAVRAGRRKSELAAATSGALTRTTARCSTAAFTGRDSARLWLATSAAATAMPAKTAAMM